MRHSTAAAATRRPRHILRCPGLFSRLPQISTRLLTIVSEQFSLLKVSSRSRSCFRRGPLPSFACRNLAGVCPSLEIQSSKCRESAEHLLREAGESICARVSSLTRNIRCRRRPSSSPASGKERLHFSPPPLLLFAVALLMPMQHSWIAPPAAAGAAARPKSFPRMAGVEYITTLHWDCRIPAELRAQFGASRPIREQLPCRKVKVLPIPREEVHPAAGQYGLFAAQVFHEFTCQW